MMRKLLIGLIATAALAGVASAQSSTKQLLDAAKAQGTIGEQADGLIGFVRPSSDQQLAAAVASVNERRLQGYRAAANAEGIDTVAAGASSFRNRLACQNVPRETCITEGEFYKPAGGGWTRK